MGKRRLMEVPDLAGDDEIAEVPGTGSDGRPVMEFRERDANHGRRIRRTPGSDNPAGDPDDEEE